MTKKEYRQKLIDLIPNKDHRNLNRPDLFYYEDEYANKIREYFESKGIKSLELNYSKKSKTTSICSFLSSGRLCYNYFRYLEKIGKVGQIVFELPLENDLPNAKEYPTKMDAVDVKNNKYFECKCDEITSNKHDYLSISYKHNSKLFNDFSINKSDIKDYDYTDSKGKIHHAIWFPASSLVDFNAILNEYPEYKTCCYNELYFDLKQLICHLLALARVDGEKQLIYVVFVPNEELDYFPLRMKKEMDCIKNSEKIKAFLAKHHISIEYKFVPIKDVVDFNYIETYGS